MQPEDRPRKIMLKLNRSENASTFHNLTDMRVRTLPPESDLSMASDFSLTIPIPPPPRYPLCNIGQHAYYHPTQAVVKSDGRRKHAVGRSEERRKKKRRGGIMPSRVCSGRESRTPLRRETSIRSSCGSMLRGRKYQYMEQPERSLTVLKVGFRARSER
jgi:hypothetical protein